ncbi:MAG: Foldase protein PrsA [candidate division WS6 bacterium GW2011_GWF2_39_15]|uniref:peptidylprolyl isomerase n=1 Tax=candidate division WS6 bacterium GW2011_GWF2_39_15 TaxID=1619100 RepID=A0A0G0QWK3_9BACT|nr:MAG: Foldase protein PrsA [candidate division WS6 bacterium GW2011_GWF2_39_15]
MPRTKSKATTSKKVVKQKTVKATPAKEATPIQPKKVEIKFNKGKLLKGVLYVALFVLAFGLIDVFVQYLNNDYSVAVVNGDRVSKGTYYDRLSKAYGVQATSTLIDESLIEQEGENKNITVTQKEIDDRVKEIADQLGGQKVLEETLKSNNITQSDIERQIKLEIITGKILKPTIKYEQKDVEAFFDQYKEVLYEGQDVKYADKKAEVETSFVNQKVEEAKTAWLDGLRSKAKIQNNVTGKPTYGVFKTVSNIVSNLVKEAKNK